MSAEIETARESAARGRPSVRTRDSRLSVVVPAFEEAGNLGPLYDELSHVLDDLGMPWELVLVDDGSADDTWAGIQKLVARDPRVRGIALSRNFGHQYALLAGLSAARGDAVVMMDADLQHPPSSIPDLVSPWLLGTDVVHSVRRDSGRETLLKRATSKLYYRLFALLSGTHLEPGMADFRLLDRRVVDTLLSFREQGLFLRGLIQWVGFSSAKVEFKCGTRREGASKYTLRKMLRLAWAGITSFSVVPLRLGMAIGLATSGVAFAGILYAFASYLAGNAVPGWASAISVTSFLFGVLFMFLGVVSEYIARILVEVRDRPRFVVRDEVGSSPHDAAPPA